jgi:mannose-6-phosphate isomerase-like protein (cupin superfamily)
MIKNIFPSRLDAGVRRVVTGIDACGQAVVVADERVTGDVRALALWAADAPPVKGDPAPPSAPEWWPPPGGVRVSLSSRKPDRAAPDGAAPEQTWPDINDAAGFHASQSTDIIIVVSGTIWLELDDGVELELHAGDTVIQNGTRHRWRNHGQDWPIIAVVIVGARDEPRPPLSG